MSAELSLGHDPFKCVLASFKLSDFCTIPTLNPVKLKSSLINTAHGCFWMKRIYTVSNHANQYRKNKMTNTNGYDCTRHISASAEHTLSRLKELHWEKFIMAWALPPHVNSKFGAAFRFNYGALRYSYAWKRRAAVTVHHAMLCWRSVFPQRLPLK